MGLIYVKAGWQDEGEWLRYGFAGLKAIVAMTNSFSLWSYKHMLSWVFLFLAVVFAYLAVDAWRFGAPWREVPFSIIAKGIGQDVSHLPLGGQLVLKQHHAVYGFGDLSGVAWLWAILAVGCIGISCYGFFG